MPGYFIQNTYDIWKWYSCQIASTKYVYVYTCKESKNNNLSAVYFQPGERAVCDAGLKALSVDSGVPTVSIIHVPDFIKRQLPEIASSLPLLLASVMTSSRFFPC